MHERHMRGFSLVESLAAIVIITFVFTGVLTIIINTQRQTVATHARIQAVEIAATIRDEILDRYDYPSLADLVSSGDHTLDQDNCGTFPPGEACDLFALETDDTVYDDQVSIVFFSQTPEDVTYRIVRFRITIMYYDTRTIEIEGVYDA